MTDSEINPDSRLRLFEELIIPHLDAAHNLARWLTRNEQDACDVVQEAYMRAFRFFEGYKGGDGKYWLLEIVRNTSFTWLRREKRNLRAVSFDERSHGSVPEANQEDALVAAADLSVLRNCIETLSEAFRRSSSCVSWKKCRIRKSPELPTCPWVRLCPAWLADASGCRKLLRNTCRRRF